MTFKILSVTIDHVKYKLSEITSSDDNTYSVLIGKNGCGKSHLLNFISDLFYRDNTSFYNHPNLWCETIELIEISKKNSIEYYINDKNVFASEISKKLAGVYGITPFPESHSTVFPESLVCVSTSPFDRFPSTKKITRNELSDNKKQEIYSYVGLRKMSQTVKVNSLIQNIVHSLLTKSEMLSKNILIMKKTLTYLGYGRRVRVSFLPTFTKKNLKLSGIEKLISECIDLNDNEEEKLSSEAILKSFNIIYNNINTISHKKVSVDLNLEKVSTEDEKIKLKAIDLLLSVGILKVSSLNLSQKSDNRKFIDFQSASSGEQCIVLMLLGIAGSIKDNSLICIDEPEISLHPEWQSTFISLLISTFEDYKGCHFIIATHSPQIVSELHGKNSYILNMDENKLHSSTDYLYRSADYQLATLFSSPGMQNEYLNRKVVSLLTHLSKNRILDTEQTAEVNMLFSLTPKMNKEDPVRVLIDILRETLEILSNDK